MGGRWLDVVLNVPVFRTFTYKNPLPDQDLAGRRVEVRFGSRTLIGFVTGVRDCLPAGFPVPEGEIKDVLRVVDKEPLYGTEQVSLARWMSLFYLCSEGEALSAMLPSGKRESANRRFSTPRYCSPPARESRKPRRLPPIRNNFV